MHKSAKAWDKRFGYKSGFGDFENKFQAKEAARYPKDLTKFDFEAGVGYVPLNRPCDWCGKAVKRGFIHKSCVLKERDFWLDIL